MPRQPLPPGRSQPSGAMSPDLAARVLAGLSEGQRATAHLVLGLILLAALVAVGVVYLVRRRRSR